MSSGCILDDAHLVQAQTSFAKVQSLWQQQFQGVFCTYTYTVPLKLLYGLSSTRVS